VNYQSIEPMVLSFNAGDEVIIYSKEAGQNKELWGAEVHKETFNIELDYLKLMVLIDYVFVTRCEVKEDTSLKD